MTTNNLTHTTPKHLLGFVRPRYLSSDGESLPLLEFIEEALFKAPEGQQLIIRGPRGSGLTTTLQWIRDLIPALSEANGVTRQAFTIDDLDKDEFWTALSAGQAILLGDLSVTPLQPKTWRKLRQTLIYGHQDRPIKGQQLAAAPLVLVTHRLPRYVLKNLDLSHPHEVVLAPWGRDDVIELLSSHPELIALRERLFLTFEGLDIKTLKSRPRTMRWLIGAAARCVDKPISLSLLFAGILDQLCPGIHTLLHTMRGRATWLERVASIAREQPIDVDQILELFEVPHHTAIELANMLGEPQDAYERSWPWPNNSHGPTNLPLTLALEGLQHFFMAGRCLEMIAQGRSPSQLNKECFPFIKDLMREGHRQTLRDWLARKRGFLKTDSAAATLLWASGETPRFPHGGDRVYQLHSAHLEGIRLSGARLSKSQFHYAKLRRARFDGAQLDHCDFTGAQAGHARFNGANADHAQFNDCFFANSQFIGSKLLNTTFQRAHLQNASFEGADLRLAMFDSCDLDRTDFDRALLANASFTNCDLRSCEIDNTQLDHTRFHHCSFEGLVLDGWEGEEVGFVSCDLSDLRLRGARLNRAYFEGCPANGLDMEGADLRGATFVNVNFHAGSSRAGMLLGKPALEGNMTHYYVEPEQENLLFDIENNRHANFRNADLRGARFHGDTSLFRVDLRGALLDDELRQHAINQQAFL